ncbi:MAG TPA: chlorite dismutase family protein [Limnobacter sp.]|nr:chlorite dismutase family protein [Limnobacter sp.]
MVNAPFSDLAEPGSWVLQGFTSNVRYAERYEINQLRAKQEGLNRPASLCAALIPIRKTSEWWAMSQDERRAIFEAQSHHTEIGLGYLPEIARQLHHSRDLDEPFDFLTWFEFAPEHTAKFNNLVAQLRASKEWEYVEREVDIRLIKNA